MTPEEIAFVAMCLFICIALLPCLMGLSLYIIDLKEMKEEENEGHAKEVDC